MERFYCIHRDFFNFVFFFFGTLFVRELNKQKSINYEK